jgi:hypothetical protein
MNEVKVCVRRRTGWLGLLAIMHSSFFAIHHHWWLDSKLTSNLPPPAAALKLILNFFNNKLALNCFLLSLENSST